MKVLRILLPVLVLLLVAVFIHLRTGSSVGSAGTFDAAQPALAPSVPSGLLSTEAAQAARAIPARPAPGGEPAKLGDPATAGAVSRDAIDQFLRLQNRSAASLLAAWSESRDRMYLREAAEKFPGDAAIQYAVLSANLYPDQRAAWLQRLREAAPQNSLADFLAAADELRAGQRDAAFAELRAAVAKPAFDDYSMITLAAREALMSASFRSPLEARIRAMAGLPMESVPLVFDAAREVLADEKAALERNDLATAAATAQLGLQIGRALDGASAQILIQQLAGLSIEERALIALSSTPGAVASLGFNPEDRLAQIQNQRDEIKRLSAVLDPTRLDSTDPRLPEFFHRIQSEGELPALRWLAAQKASK